MNGHKMRQPATEVSLQVKDALLLIGHGSARFADAACGLADHAQRVAATGRFPEVGIGMLHGEPSVASALARLTAPRIRVVPFFMEDGYFTRVAVPRALGLPPAAPPNGAISGGRQLLLCPPIGLHHAMAALLERRVRDGCATLALPPTATAVIIVGHGSSSAPGRALALHRHTATLAATGALPTLLAACLEEPPLLADTLRAWRTHTVAVVSYFAGAGGHVRDDVPALIAAERTARGASGPEVHNFGCVTDSPSMLQIILDQANPA